MKKSHNSYKAVGSQGRIRFSAASPDVTWDRTIIVMVWTMQNWSKYGNLEHGPWMTCEQDAHLRMLAYALRSLQVHFKFTSFNSHPGPEGCRSRRHKVLSQSPRLRKAFWHMDNRGRRRLEELKAPERWNNASGRGWHWWSPGKNGSTFGFSGQIPIERTRQSSSYPAVINGILKYSFKVQGVKEHECKVERDRL